MYPTLPIGPVGRLAVLASDVCVLLGFDASIWADADTSVQIVTWSD